MRCTGAISDSTVGWVEERDPAFSALLEGMIIKHQTKQLVGSLTAKEEACMEKIVNVHIEKLSEGVYLATSDEIQGLVAQGRTIQETLEIARDVARRLLEASSEREGTLSLPPVREVFDYPLIVNT